MRDVVAFILNAFNGFVLVYFIVLNTSYLVLIWLAATMTKHRVQRDDTAALEDILTSPLTPSISVIIPAWNEEAFIVDSAQAALRLRYPDHEVVIVDDGSTDSTFERLRTAFDLVEVTPIDDSDVPLRGAIRSVHVPASGDRLTVVRKENAGTRADAVNAGVNAASKQLVCFVDADSLLEADALLRTVQPFVDDPDRIVATGGVIRALNGCEVIDGEVVDARQPTTWVARIQVIEYLRSFLLGRTGWSRLGALMIISGAFGLYRRDIVVELGGLDDESLGEDF
ncbi:MAG: glycosyltransferase family 2 protein, partial [Actinomycetota bacterium]